MALYNGNQLSDFLSDMEENDYREHVFLYDLRNSSNRDEEVLWRNHQEMQYSFLLRHGFLEESNVLDLGCGPMRLGVKLIPKLRNGWYFGQDINPETLKYGEEVLREAEINKSANYTLFSSEGFDLSLIDRPIDIAFSNSLFSHLNINSILMCLLKVREVLSPKGIYFSTFFNLESKSSWLDRCVRNKWGHDTITYPSKDPYHYHFQLLKKIAREAGFTMRIVPDYGHPTQTMASFTPRGFLSF